MRPIELTLSGWGPYRDLCKVSFEEFKGKGIFLITGPTGAGKTSIFDAICFALYGNMSGQMREKGSVRSDFADAETKTFVELFMEHAGEQYRIIRNPEYMRQKKRKSGNNEYTKEKENAILHLPDGKIIEGNVEVTRKIQEILVLDYPQFKQISMIAQGEFTKLLTASSKDKIAILREIFDTGIYERFGNILRQRSKILFDRGSEIKHKLEEVTSSLQICEDTYSALVEVPHKNYENILQYLIQLEKEYKIKQDKLQKNFEKLEKKISSLTSDISKGNELKRQWKLLEEARQKIDQMSISLKNIEIQEKELEAAVKAGTLESAYIEIQNLQKRLKQIGINRESTCVQLKEYEKEIQKLQSIYEERASIQKCIDLLEANQLREKKIASLLSDAKNTLKELESMQADYLQAEIKNQKAKEEFNEADSAYKRAAIGIAAKLLQNGEPCPVCGSLEHPRKAEIDEKIPSESTLELLRKEVEQTEEQLTEMFYTTTKKKVMLESMSLQIKEERNGSIQERKQIEDFTEEQKVFQELSVQEGRKLLNKYTERYQLLLGLMSEKKNQKEQLKKEEEILSEELSHKKDEWNRILQKYNFCSDEDYLSCLKTLDERKKIEKEIRDFREEYRANEEMIYQLSQNLSEVKIPQTQELEMALLEQNKEKEELLKQQKDQHIRLSQVQNAKKSIKEKLVDLDQINQEYGYIKDLDNMTNGNNSKRLIFEQYVLASYFEEILKAANLRFPKMSGGRYEMSRLGKISDGRTKDNLEIQVLDCYTGKYRSVKTLSGGEAFKASLSLALGMSDVIQSFHGGIRIDTLFVDEGFGSLDSESLDQACEALFSLVEKDRLIGIISHVPELREKVQCQLKIHKTNSGSTIKTMVQ